MTPPRPRVTLEALDRDGHDVSGRVLVDNVDDPVEVQALGNDTYRVSIAGQRFEVVVARGQDTDWGCVDGRGFRWPRGRPEDDPQHRDAADRPIATTMPATVSTVKVTAGQSVSRGDTLVVLEAMKMEIPITAPRDGRVTAVRCAEGAQVDPGVPLVELEGTD